MKIEITDNGLSQFDVEMDEELLAAGEDAIVAFLEDAIAALKSQLLSVSGASE